MKYLESIESIERGVLIERELRRTFHNCKPMAKPTDRAPLLSGEEACKMLAGNRDALPMAEFNAAGKIIAWYESKITSGELRVVRLMSGNGIPNMTPTDTWTDSPWLCDDCGTEWMQRQNDIEVERPSFCPGCGAQIVKG